MPPRTGVVLPSIEVPAPNGMIETSAATQARTRPTTSSVEWGKATPSGSTVSKCELAAAVRGARRPVEVQAAAYDRPQPIGNLAGQAGGHVRVLINA